MADKVIKKHNFLLLCSASLQDISGHGICKISYPLTLIFNFAKASHQSHHLKKSTHKLSLSLLPSTDSRIINLSKYYFLITCLSYSKYLLMILSINVVLTYIEFSVSFCTIIFLFPPVFSASLGRSPSIHCHKRWWISCKNPTFY